MRYEEKGGVRPLPLVISKPWSIQAYTRLMMKSYLKSRLYEQLKLHGHIPDLDKDTDPEMSADVRAMEELSRAGALKVDPPTVSKEPEVARPALLDAIMKAMRENHHTGHPGMTGIACRLIVTLRLDDRETPWDNAPVMAEDQELSAPSWVLVQPQWGLCNRLRAVVAGQMLAEHLGRQFVLDWQPLPGCNCCWTDLFSTPVLEVKKLDEAPNSEEYGSLGLDNSPTSPESIDL
eukprot:symbB.v1.2.016217.t1/scaffold1231.1/size130510/10